MMLRRIGVIIGTICFFIFVWFSRNMEYITFPTLENLYAIHESPTSYTSILAYSLFYSIPFLFILINFFLSENILISVRGTRRERQYRRIVLRKLLIAFIFSMLHTVINVLFILLFFGWSLLRETNFFYASILNMMLLTFFYLSQGLFYQFLYDVLNSIVVAIFLYLLFIGSLYFIFHFNLNLGMWIPINDLSLYSVVLKYDVTKTSLLLAYIKQLGVIVIMYLIGITAYLRKDFIKV